MQSNQPLQDEICLSSSIVRLAATTSEKVLLACICQRAALTNGRCEASNAELAQETAIPFKTVTKLVLQLIAEGWLQSRVEKEQANKRFLEPQAVLLAHYTQKENGLSRTNAQNGYRAQGGYTHFEQQGDVGPVDYTQNGQLSGEDDTHLGNAITTPGAQNGYSIPAPYTQNGNSLSTGYTQKGIEAGNQPAPATQNEQPAHSAQSMESLDHIHRRPGKTTTIGHRPCLITGVDISQQQQDVHYVDQATLLALARHHPPTFQALFERFLPGETPDPTQLNSHSKRIARAVRDLAASGQPFEPLNLPPRLCPVTGVDLSHQSLRKEIVSMSTLTSMYMNDRLQFDQLVTRFLSEAQRVGGMKLLSERLFKRVERLAQQQTDMSPQ